MLVIGRIKLNIRSLTQLLVVSTLTVKKMLTVRKVLTLRGMMALSTSVSTAKASDAWLT
jgi:hypothetical protein